MSITSEKLQYLKETKEHIKNAIINKGVNIPEDAKFRDYENYIANIPTDGAVPLNRRYEHYEGPVISVIGSDNGFTKNNKYTASYAGTPIEDEYLLKFNVNNGIGVEDRYKDKNITFKIPYPICTINRNGKVYKNEIKYNSETNKYEFIRQCKTNKEELLSTKQVSDTSPDKITIPYESWHCGSVAVGNLLYILGGRGNSNAISAMYYSRLMVFDAKTRNVTTLSPIPVGRQYHNLVHHNGKLYSIGGIISTGSTTTDLYIYDIETDTWTQGSSMTYARQNSIVEVVNDKIYVIGGEGSSAGNKVEVYNIVSDEWTKLNDIQVSAIYSSAHNVYNNKIYIYGGYQGYANATEISVYDTENDTWEIGVNYLSKSCGSYANAILYNNKVYISGGNNNPSGFTIYDIVNNKFLEFGQPLMPVGLYSHYSIINDNILYLVGGFTSDNTSYSLSPSSSNSSQHYIAFDLERNIFTTLYHGSIYTGAHYYTSNCEHNNYLYFLGSHTSTTNSYSYCLKYNLKTQRFETMANAPNSRAAMAVGVLNGKLYSLGGRSNSTSMSNIYIYDIDSNKWTTHTTTIPKALYNMGYTTHDNKLYYGGGYDSVDYSYCNNFYCYDPTLDMFEELPNLPFKGGYISMISVDKYIYLMGGYDSSNGSTYTNRCYKYDTETKEFTYISNMPTPRRCGATIEIDGKIYVIGGYNSSIGDLSMVEVYDIATDTWTVLPNIKGSTMPYAGLGYYNGYIQIVNVTVATISTSEKTGVSKTILLDINKIVEDDVELNEIIELEGNFDLPTNIHNTIISPTTGENVIIECDVPVSYKV